MSTDKNSLTELDMVASQKDFAAPISYWADVFARELSRLNGGRISVSEAMPQYAQAFTQAAIEGKLIVRDKVTMIPVTVNDEVLVTKEDLRAWVDEYCPELRSRLLGFVMYGEQEESK